MEDKMISIIVPVYNAEKYLAECIESVLHQTYLNWELILVDDGSTDSSLNICKAYEARNSQIRVFHKQNGGVSSARNAGIENANGDFITFVDADDTITEDCLAVLFSELQKNGADIVSGLEKNDSSLRTECIIWKGEDSVLATLGDHPLTYAAWAKLYKREAIGDIRFRDGIRINEDSLFVFEILLNCPIFVGINKKIYSYRKTDQSASRAEFSEKYFDILRVSEIKYKMIQQKFPEFLAQAENVRLKAKMNLLHILAMRTQGEYKEQEKSLLKDVRENAKYYISATKADDRWMFILKFHLYWLYAIIKRI